MRHLSTLALLARLAIVLVAGPTWVARSALVIELTSDTFDMVVDGSTNVLVMFHAFDCGHCKAIEPEFEDVASVVRPQHDLVLAMVDCDTQRSIARRFEITGYPTFKWFEKGSIQADKFHLVHFGGRRMGDTFIKLITDDTRMPHLRLIVNNNKNLVGGETDGGDGLGEEAEAAAAQQMVGGALVLPPVVDHWSKVTHHTFPAFVASPTSPSRGEAEGVNVKGCGGSSGGALVYVHTPWNDRDDVKVSLRQVADAFLRASTSTKLSCLPRFGRMAMRTGAERDVLQAYGVKEFPAFLVFGEGNETEALATAGSQKDQERHDGGNEDSGRSGGGGGVGGERNEDKSAGKWSLLAASYGSDSLSDPHALVKLATSSLPSHSGTGESATDRNFVKVPARRTSSLTEFQNHHDDDDGKGFSVLSASTVATLPTTFLSATVGEYHRRFFERVQSDSEEDSAVGGGGGSSSDGDDDGGGGRENRVGGQKQELELEASKEAAAKVLKGMTQTVDGEGAATSPASAETEKQCAKVLQRISERGHSYVRDELKRLTGLTKQSAGNMSEKKRSMFQKRAAILRAFEFSLSQRAKISHAEERPSTDDATSTRRKNEVKGSPENEEL